LRRDPRDVGLSCAVPHNLFGELRRKVKVMSANVQACPKCQGEMVQGFVAEFAAAQTLVSTWVEGRPEKSVLYGAKIPVGKSIPIGTFRCAACGYLESYARPQFGARWADGQPITMKVFWLTATVIVAGVVSTLVIHWLLK
jgi:hypothetical protein